MGGDAAQVLVIKESFFSIWIWLGLNWKNLADPVFVISFFKVNRTVL